MPSTSSQQRRGRPVPRRSPRAARPVAAPVRAQRPVQVPVAVVFAVLVAAVDGYLAWLLDFGWYLLVPVALAVLALGGAALVWQGRRRGWLVLAVAALVPLLGLLGLTFLFGVLAGGTALWSALLMLIAPLGCLVLALQRPVRRWRGGGAPVPSPGGRRAPVSSR